MENKTSTYLYITYLLTLIHHFIKSNRPYRNYKSVHVRSGLHLVTYPNVGNFWDKGTEKTLHEIFVLVFLSVLTSIGIQKVTMNSVCLRHFWIPKIINTNSKCVTKPLSILLTNLFIYNKQCHQK